MNNISFSPLERQVLKLLLNGDDPMLNSLRQQLCSSRNLSRQFSGVGYYLRFDVPKQKVKNVMPSNVKSSFCFGDVNGNITIGDYQQMIGFLLWVENGYLNQLEVYTYGGEKWPDKFDEFQLSYMDDPRDLDSLRQNWEITP
jgi:hypothetical protein